MGQKKIQDKTVKRYYWLKLKEEFFQDKEVKKLRKIAGGDTYTIIYLKLMLLSLKSDGRLYFDGIEDTFHEELALEIDEDAENVRVTLMYLEKMGLVKVEQEDEIFLTQMDSLIVSESESAQRVREHRARLKNNSDTKKIEAKSNALRQKQFRAKTACAEKQHVPFIEDYQNNKRYGGNYYVVIKRDKFRCAICNSIENLCVHHIDGFDESKPQNNETNKMLTLCRNCHSKVHAGLPINEDILEAIDYFENSNEMLPSNTDVTISNGIETNCNTYTDTYIEKEADKDTDIDNPPLPPTGEEPKEAPKEESNEYDYNAHTNVENVKYVLNLGNYHEREYIRQNMKLYECIKDWMAYKDAKKPKTSNHYVNDKSIKTLLDKFVTNSKTYGVDAVIAVVNDAMSQCYQGIVWERTERIKPQSGSSLDNIDIGDDG